MIYIPKFISTSAVISFWAVLSVLGFVLLIFIYSFIIPSFYFILVCFAGILIFTLFTFYYPLVFKSLYAYYNGFIRRILIPLINSWVLGILFYIILFVNRIYGNRLELSAREATESTWHPKTISDLLGGSGSSVVANDDSEYGAWLSRMYKWVIHTGNWWIIALIPFMLILSITYEDSEESSMSGDTYTLY